jgi:hypothetical protein
VAGIPIPEATRRLLDSDAVAQMVTIDEDGGPHVTAAWVGIEGGAPELLQRLAYTYLGPDVVFPNMPDPPPGYITRITPERLGGVGPWNPPGR